MLFDYLVIRILNPSYRPSGAAGDLHTRVPRKCAAFLPEAMRLEDNNRGRVVAEQEV